MHEYFNNEISILFDSPTFNILHREREGAIRCVKQMDDSCESNASGRAYVMLMKYDTNMSQRERRDVNVKTVQLK